MSASSQPPSATTSTQETFSPSSSPPLILAFLAIGLFSAAVAFVFWRRIQGNRGGWRLTTTPLNNTDHSFYFNLPIVNFEVPKLWDLSNGGNFARGGQGDKEGATDLSSDVIWVNLMPLSAYKEVMHSPVADGSIEEPHRQHPPNSLHTISNPLSWWKHRQSSSSSSSHDNNDGEKEPDEEVTMRVAITIALPSPKYPIHIKNTGQEAGENNMDRQNMTDYCIGTYEYPWH